MSEVPLHAPSADAALSSVFPKPETRNSRPETQSKPKSMDSNLLGFDVVSCFWMDPALHVPSAAGSPLKSQAKYFLLGSVTALRPGLAAYGMEPRARF